MLLIEDDAATRNLYKEVLEEANFLVDAAGDGKEGLRMALEGGYDLLIIDIMLPRVDGLTIMSELNKTQPKRQNGKIFILTNLEHDEVVNQGMKLGAIGYLVKSDINPDKLVEKINDYFDHK